MPELLRLQSCSCALDAAHAVSDCLHVQALNFPDPGLKFSC